MNGLQIHVVPCHIAGMDSGTVLLEENIVSKSPRDRQHMRVKDFIQIALACNCAPNYSCKICKVNGPVQLPYDTTKDGGSRAY